MRPFSTALAALALGLSILPACGSDDEDKNPCQKARDAFCHCETTFCSDPESASCTPDEREWADCINAATDACNSNCFGL